MHVSLRDEIEETKKAIEEHVPVGLKERIYVWG